LAFSSPLFLFLFLPAVLAIHFVLPRGARNAWLLLASLVFYAWGEPKFVPVMLASILANYGLGLLVDRQRGRPAGPWVLALAITLNVSLLVAYKYVAFLAHTLGWMSMRFGAGPIEAPPVALPIGISFITFHALSYLIDVHRGESPARKNPFDVALYIALFPKLVAGPIVRYAHLAPQLTRRTITLDDFALGVRRFVIGLGKKVLIANRLAVPADAIFAVPPDQLTLGLSWLGAVCYTLQIYCDFSGYSDMAIGLGRMLGFRFLENFDHPYVASSLREFWQRWHISLSTWFRDYLYVPLGGGRRSPARVYFNLVTVFALCGLWHGARWSFMVWGLFHGSFLVIERLGFRERLESWPAPLRHVYVLLVVAVGWVLFRADSLAGALWFLVALAGGGHGTNLAYHPSLYLDAALVLALAAGAAASLPILPLLARWRERHANAALGWAVDLAGTAALALLLLTSCMALAAGTYNPFIYYRF
jgi:alginate O-acetyltransferase complex protein AlgI